MRPGARQQKYRIVREVFEDSGDGCEPTYSYTIREVFYAPNGKPYVCSEETIPYGTTRAELQENLLLMINALIYPALDEDCDEV